jgi:hypothetical protein
MIVKSVYLVGKHWSDTFSVQNGLKQRDALSPLLFNFALEATGYGLDERGVGVRVPVGSTIFFSPRRPDQ